MFGNTQKMLLQYFLSLCFFIFRNKFVVQCIFSETKTTADLWRTMENVLQMNLNRSFKERAVISVCSAEQRICYVIVLCDVDVAEGEFSVLLLCVSVEAAVGSLRRGSIYSKRMKVKTENTGHTYNIIRIIEVESVEWSECLVSVDWSTTGLLCYICATSVMLMSYEPMWAEPLNVQDNKINKSLLKLSTTLLKKSIIYICLY